MGSKRYTVHRSMFGDGRDYEPGDDRVLSDADAAPLLESGAIALEGEEPLVRRLGVQNTFGQAVVQLTMSQIETDRADAYAKVDILLDENGKLTAQLSDAEAKLAAAADVTTRLNAATGEIADLREQLDAALAKVSDTTAEPDEAKADAEALRAQLAVQQTPQPEAPPPTKPGKP